MSATLKGSAGMRASAMSSGAAACVLLISSLGGAGSGAGLGAGTRAAPAWRRAVAGGSAAPRLSGTPRPASRPDLTTRQSPGRIRGSRSAAFPRGATPGIPPHQLMPPPRQPFGILKVFGGGVDAAPCRGGCVGLVRILEIEFEVDQLCHLHRAAPPVLTRLQ